MTLRTGVQSSGKSLEPDRLARSAFVVGLAIDSPTVDKLGTGSLPCDRPKLGVVIVATRGKAFPSRAKGKPFPKWRDSTSTLAFCQEENNHRCNWLKSQSVSLRRSFFRRSPWRMTVPDHELGDRVVFRRRQRRRYHPAVADRPALLIRRSARDRGHPLQRHGDSSRGSRCLDRSVGRAVLPVDRRRT